MHIMARMSIGAPATAPLWAVIVVLAVVAAADDGGYGNYGYGYGKKKVQPVRSTYIYKPMPLPSFTSYSPAYGFGQAYGQFQPGVFRPVFHDQYQTVKVGFDTNRSPVVFTHMRYVPRLPPPVYGDLGAISQNPTISEDFSTNSTHSDEEEDDDDDYNGDEEGESGYGGSSSYDDGAPNDYGSDVSQHQYSSYFNGTYGDDGNSTANGDDDGGAPEPSSSTLSSTTSTSTTTPRTTTTTTTTTTAKPSVLPDEQPAYGFGDELNNAYSYRDVAPIRRGSNNNDDNNGDYEATTTTSAIADFLADSDSVSERANDRRRASSDGVDEHAVSEEAGGAVNNGGRRMYGQPAAPATTTTSEAAPTTAPSQDGAQYQNNMPSEQQQQDDSEQQEQEAVVVRPPEVSKYLLQDSNNEVSEDEESPAAYGYKGSGSSVAVHRFGRKQRPAADSAETQQTIYSKGDGDEKPAAGKTRQEQQPQLDYVSGLLADGASLPPKKREQLSELNTVKIASLPSAKKVLDDFNSDDGVNTGHLNNDDDDEQRPVAGSRRRRYRRKRPRQPKRRQLVIEVNNKNGPDDNSRPQLNARTLMPHPQDEQQQRVVAVRRRTASPTPQQQRELDIQRQLQEEFNVPQQVVQPFRSAKVGSPTGQANLEQRFSVPRMLVSDKPVAPSPENVNDLSSRRRRQQHRQQPSQAPAVESSLEHDFDVPRNVDAVVSEHPPEIAPPTTSVRGGRQPPSRSIPTVWAL